MFLLPKEVIEEVYVCLGDTKEIISCCLVAKEWSLAGAGSVWRRLAEIRFTAPTAHESLADYAGSWKNLMMDDNKRGTLLSALPLERHSFYKHNRVNYWFACEVLEMRWDRHNRHLRIYMNARGEIDLRHPEGSSLRLYHQQGGTSSIQVIKPIDWVPQVQHHGHHRGYLTFPMQATDEVFPVAKFMFANSHPGFSDYPGVALWKETSLDSLFENAPYVGKVSAPPLINETNAEEHTRWEEGGLVPHHVLERHRVALAGSAVWWTNSPAIRMEQ